MVVRQGPSLVQLLPPHEAPGSIPGAHAVPAQPIRRTLMLEGDSTGNFCSEVATRSAAHHKT